MVSSRWDNTDRELKLTPGHCTGDISHSYTVELIQSESYESIREPTPVT